jgi:anthraniloyl-CoA monooxygenase
VHERGPDGVFAVHGYPISDAVSTFIVETDEASWQRAGLDEFDVTQPPGVSDMVSKEYLEKLFAEQIEGRQLLVNNSRWGNFRTRRTRRWCDLRGGSAGAPPVVFLGDAVHTAHFSVGSGTKMAMEDAIELARALVDQPDDLPAALAAYEVAAQPSVRRIQDAARPSLAWWEHFGRYHDAFAPWQFAYHFLSRSITDARLARRDPGFVAASHRGWVEAHGAEPLQTPFEGAGWCAPGRLVAVSTGDDAAPVTVSGESGALSLSVGPQPGPWGALVAAPDQEADLPGVFARLAELARLGPAAPVLAAVHAGTALTRVLVCEQARLQERLPALLVDPDTDPDRALTTVLSGRADLVGGPA